MKKNLIISVRLTVVFIILLSVLYPVLISFIGQASPGAGNGEKLELNGKTVGYANIGQQFRSNRYFWGRPSAVAYNAAGSGGSNKGPANPDYLQTVQDRIDSFLAHHPGVSKKDIPSELVTASASGLDPDISPAAALLQVNRIAAIRNIEPHKLVSLVQAHTEAPFAGIMGPSKVNVLKLNIALDQLK